MKNIKTVLLSLLVMALWGSLFPVIKIGYRALNITSGFIPDILLFAGFRFVISGLLMCLYCIAKKEKLAPNKAKSVGSIVIMGLFSIVLHYGLHYIGLSTTDSSKAALTKQLGALLYVCFSFLFIKNEKFSLLKMIGALVGFGGIIAINYSHNGLSLSSGDIFIIGSSISTVVANIIGKKAVIGSSPFWVTGISQLSGGLLLFAVALAKGAHMLSFNLQGALVFSYICLASIVSYPLWYAILRTSNLSQMFIIRFAEPLFACLFGALLLGENILKPQYLIAFILISLGIVLGNQSTHSPLKKEKGKHLTSVTK